MLSYYWIVCLWKNISLIIVAFLTTIVVFYAIIFFLVHLAIVDVFDLDWINFPIPISCLGLEFVWRDVFLSAFLFLTLFREELLCLGSNGRVPIFGNFCTCCFIGGLLFFNAVATALAIGVIFAD